MNIYCKNRRVWHPRAGRFLIALLASAVLTACHTPVRHNANEPVRLSGEAQGTYYSILYFDSLQRNLQPQIDSLLDDFDLTASLWVDSSLLRRLNANLTDTLNPLLADLLQQSLYINRYTDGAFDCRIGALVNLYGFGFKKRDQINPAQIDTILSHLTPDAYLITDSSTHTPPSAYTLRRTTPIEFDFNAIAQGYTVDLLAQLYDTLGIQSYLIDVGGEVIARGTKPDGSPWTVGIERPSENKYSNREIETAIALCNQSVVTSGNYRKYYEHDGVRYSHTLNPSTGQPVNHSLLSVSVISRHSWYADAMATAFMVMGLDKSLQFIQQHPDNPDIQAVFFIYNDHGQYRTHATQAFQSLIIQ